MRVVEQLLEVNGRLIFSAPKTAAGVRTVALPPFLVEVMVDHVARYGQPGADGLIFVMPERTPLRRENFRRRVWYPAVRAAGMEVSASTTSGTPAPPSQQQAAHHSPP